MERNTDLRPNQFRSEAVNKTRRGGIHSAIDRGQVPWFEKGDELIKDRLYCSIDEIKFIYNLSLMPDFQYSKESNNSGKPMIKLIVPIVNEKYHEGDAVRGVQAICSKLCDYRKFLERKVNT